MGLMFDFLRCLSIWCVGLCLMCVAVLILDEFDVIFMCLTFF